jgi:hypothetical protein
MIFDILIPLGHSDFEIIHKTIIYTKKFIIGYRNIFIVSHISPNIPDTIFIDEKIFPFNVESYLGKNSRNGWYFQQLIKLYAAFIIPNISENYLVLDSDTFFLKPTTFFEDGLPLYNISDEFHLPYFIHMNRLYPSFYKASQYSGIVHHMIFQKQILEKLFSIVEDYHQKQFYIAFLECVDKNSIHGSGASEYEIYFNFLHKFCINSFKIRQLKWNNMKFNEEYFDFENNQYAMISHHHHL